MAILLFILAFIVFTLLCVGVVIAMIVSLIRRPRAGGYDYLPRTGNKVITPTISSTDWSTPVETYSSSASDSSYFEMNSTISDSNSSSTDSVWSDSSSSTDSSSSSSDAGGGGAGGDW